MRFLNDVFQWIIFLDIIIIDPIAKLYLKMLSYNDRTETISI